MTPLAALTTGVVFALISAAHCAGMCGAFAMRAASAPGGLAGFILYGTGKAFTYAFIGALAGWLGAGVLAAGTEAQIALGLLVGALMIVMAVLRLLGPRPPSTVGAQVGRFLQPLIALAGREGAPGGRFTLGALTGALPCGVVYIAALQATAAGSRFAAFALMAGFAVGTLPVLAAVALLGRGIMSKVSPRAARLASGILLLLLGIVALARAALPMLRDGTGSPCCH